MKKGCQISDNQISIAGFQQREYLRFSKRPVYNTHVLQFVGDRRGDLAQLVMRNARFPQRFWDIELGDERFGAIGASQRGRLGIFGIERNAIAFRDGAETLRGHLRHVAHGVGQSDAGRHAMRDVPARPDLVPEQVREAEARVHGAINRIPCGELAVAAMRDAFLPRGPD